MGHIERTEQKRFMQFMFKPTLACNLACKYCHIHSSRDEARSVITLEMAKEVFSWILNYCKAERINVIDILWHGGEPLLTDSGVMSTIIGYYTELFENNDISVSNSIQTNLLLLSDDKLPIIEKYFNNTVGFSFDFNSTDRCYRNGKDASADIWAKALYLRRHGVNLGAITQITQDNYLQIEDIYQMFKHAGINFKFSRIRETDIFQGSLRDEDYAAAVTKLFTVWVEDDSQAILISNFVEYINMLLAGKSSSCCFQKDCNILSFMADGSIFYCDRSISNGPVGNIFKDTPSEVKSNIFERIKRDFYVPHQCKECKYSSVCNSGCPFNVTTGWYKHECISLQMILDYISEYLVTSGYNVIIR